MKGLDDVVVLKKFAHFRLCEKVALHPAGMKFESVPVFCLSPSVEVVLIYVIAVTTLDF